MINKIKELHSQGLTNRKIAQAIGCHHSTVGGKIIGLGLKPNGNGPKKLNIVSDNLAICSKCLETKDIELFQYSHTNKGKLSYCNDCRNVQNCDRINESIESYFTHRVGQLKTRSKKLGIKYNLDIDYVLELYNIQKGNCFYSDKEMKIFIGGGLSQDSLSFDKIIPEIGYVKGNVVLCTKRVNTCKNDVSLDEMKEWMPGWYDRVLRYQVAPGAF